MIGYILGSIPFALIVGKVGFNIDVRQHGSGNLGATNVFRTLGVKAGSIVLIADILKGAAATWVGMAIIGATWHPLLFGCAAVLGHVFPLFARFKGGKAVATSAGVLLAFAPVLFVVIIASFLLTLYLSKYVSLSSMVAGIVGTVFAITTGNLILVFVTLGLTLFVVLRHLANIKRIVNKTEPKIKWM